MFDALLYLALSIAGLVTVIRGVTARQRGMRTTPHYALATALYVAAGLIAIHAGNTFYAGICAGSVAVNSYMWWDGVRRTAPSRTGTPREGS
ncbi:hypothetical protein [Streptomyces sp. NPDC055105]|uniref:hypothetical protein n=1 Tax=Streptomyces sp. NPDC055105 TaxID=3365719 RepID=UPI0037D8B813